MTYTSTTAGHAERGAGSAALPAIGSIILAALWGAYTIAVFYEIVFATGG